MLLLTYMLAITALCLVTHRNKAQPSTLYAIGLIGVIGGASLTYVLLVQGSAGIAFISLSSSGMNQAYLDSYYVVYAPASLFWILASAALLGLPLWLWLLERWGAMTEPALTRSLLWPIMILLFYQPGVLLLIGFSSVTPSVELMQKLSTVLTSMGLLGLFFLVLIMGWCVIRKLRN